MGHTANTNQGRHGTCTSSLIKKANTKKGEKKIKMKILWAKEVGLRDKNQGNRKGESRCTDAGKKRAVTGQGKKYTKRVRKKKRGDKGK